ncbi:hypothetical protein Tco_0676888 [Tanacetum coccineum]
MVPTKKVFSTWMTFGGNTRDLGSFGEETDEITDLHQILEENVNPSYSTSNREFLDPKKKREIESWLEDSRIVDSLNMSDEIEYFDTFPTLEELEYHEWLLMWNVGVQEIIAIDGEVERSVRLQSPQILTMALKCDNLSYNRNSCSIFFFCCCSLSPLTIPSYHGATVIHHPPNNRHVLPTALRVRINQDLHELKVISAFVDSRLESIKQFLNNFTDQPNETNMNNLETDDESGETPLVSPFPHSDNDSDDEEVLNELCEYENVRMLRREKAINSFDGDDLTFQCMIGFRKFTAYFDPFLPMNIITRKSYNTIMVEGLESTGKNLVAIVKDVYMFVGSFTYTTDFVVLENIGEFI